MKKNNKGFSLVELIVVIAVMAVLVVVLAPAYLRYVEKSRLQKDISAIGEVIQAIKVAGSEEVVANEIQNWDDEADGHKTFVEITKETGVLEAYRQPDSKTADNLETTVREIIGEKVELKNKVLKENGITLRVRRDMNYNIFVEVETFDYRKHEEEKEALENAFPSYESATKKGEAAIKQLGSVASNKFNSVYDGYYQTALGTVVDDAYNVAYDSAYAVSKEATKYFFWMSSEQKEATAKAAAKEAGDLAKKEAEKNKEALAKVVATAKASGDSIDAAVNEYNTNEQLREDLKDYGVESVEDLERYLAGQYGTGNN